MLLFIVVFLLLQSFYLNFNTSHVTVYQEEARTLTGYKLFQYISCYCLSVFLFISFYGGTKFQYISCYCLSSKIWILPPWFSDFNTSHVTVYLVRTEPVATIALFQYISCYCLSMPLSFSSSSMPRFQYISCYCLSILTLLLLVQRTISIHLMLLFILPAGILYLPVA